MRIPLVAGNWKMNKSTAETAVLVDELITAIGSYESVERVICPPFTSLMVAHSRLFGTGIGLGAQNLHWKPSGAYTGEVSPAMVREWCEYVIIGHSERRQYFGETDETVNQKTMAALEVGLIPIVCVGETLDENEKGQTQSVLDRQLRLGLAGLSAEQSSRIVIAYEPVWAIGTGRAASGELANQVLSDMIRPVLADLFGWEIAAGTRILYGGSVTAANAAEFFTQPEIDGALVGGASLKVADFQAIVKAAAG
jgi:triosephosphate isomerase